MWIEIKSDVFETKDFKSLNFLLQLLTWSPGSSIARYNVLIDSRQICTTDNYKKLSFDDKMLLDDEFSVFVTQNAAPKYTISIYNSARSTFNIEEAIRFFIQPTSIIVENSKNDASFVKAILYHFDNKNSTGIQVLVEHLKNGWIQFENAGGCGNVENFIEGKLQSFNELSSKNNKFNHQYIRCMVILDSDKEYEAQPQKPHYVNLEKYLNSKEITNYHFLEKRMMENYMPDEVIENIEHKRTTKWINVYKTLSNIQKDFLDYKNGFSKELDDSGIRKQIKPDIMALYNIPAANFEILDKGLEYPNFKDSFPLNFVSSPLVNKAFLKKRSGTDELERILEKIKRLV